ncbi:acyltransferase family protein [Bifidobacterium animalis subsp. animalis]|nr:acyltransferase family protein [Bifidobacterium animalis subsp. animalis]
MRRFFARKGSTPAGAIDRAAQHDHAPRAPRAVEGEASNAPDLPVAAGTKVSRDVPRGGAQARHFNGVDGLRAIAIVAIIAYHARPMLLKGGFLGVTLFLVVSGFFITRSLMNAVDDHRFLLFDYLRRRVKRLWPAVLSTIGLTAVLVYACAPPLILKMRGDAVPSALFYSNWSFIFRKLSYFDAAGLPSPLTHLWYTSLIMQFYLLWPLIFIPLFLHCRRHWVRIGVLGALIAAGTLEMMVLYRPGADTSRLYYGLDTRAAEILVGVLLAVLVHDRASRSDQERRAADGRIVFDRQIGRYHAVLRRGDLGVVAAGICALALALGFLLVDARAAWMYHGGFLFFAVVSAVLLYVSMQDARVGRILGVKALRYLGSRSFSLYLVHYPLLEVMNPATRTTGIPWYERAGQFLVILVAGEAFYQIVEALTGTPWLPWMRRRITSVGAGRLRTGAWILTIVGVVMTFVMALPLDWRAIAHARSVKARPELALTAEQARERLAQQQKRESETGKENGKEHKDSSDKPNAQAKPKVAPPVVKALKVPANLEPQRWACDRKAMVCQARVLMIGDSVTEGVSDTLREHFPNATIDGAVSRQFDQGVQILRDNLARGMDPQVIVFALGTNGPVSEQMAQQVIDLAGGRPLYFATTRAPVDWVPGNNATFIGMAERNPNVGIIDWSGTSQGRDDYLYDDGIHPNQLGMQAYLQMFFNAFCA